MHSRTSHALVNVDFEKDLDAYEKTLLRKASLETELKSLDSTIDALRDRLKNAAAQVSHAVVTNGATHNEPNQATAIVRKRGSGAPTFPEGTDPRLQRTLTETLKVLDNLGGKASVKDMRKKMKLSSTGISLRLRKASDAGFVRSVSKGVYERV